MDELFITNAGNVVEVTNRIQGTTITFNRVGFLDADGDSHTADGTVWCVLPEEWLSGAIKSGVMRPAVQMIGGGWMLESEYAEIEIIRAEVD